MDQLKLHRTVIVDGVDPLEKQNVAQFIASRCGKVEKWWTEKPTQQPTDSNSSNSNATLRLIFVFEDMSDLGTVAMINRMKFGDREISCRLADTSNSTSVGDKFKSILAIAAGPSANSSSNASTSSSSSLSNAVPDESYQDATIKAAHDILKSLGASAVFNQKIKSAADQQLLNQQHQQQFAGVSSSSSSSSSPSSAFNCSLDGLPSCLEYPVSETTVSNPKKNYSFMADQATRQVRALVYLTKKYIQERRKDVMELKRQVNAFSGSLVFDEEEKEGSGQGDDRVLNDDEKQQQVRVGKDEAPISGSNKKNENRVDGDSASSSSPSSSSSSSTSSSSDDNNNKKKKKHRDKDKKDKKKKSKKEKKSTKKKSKKEKNDKKHKKKESKKK